MERTALGFGSILKSLEYVLWSMLVSYQDAGRSRRSVPSGPCLSSCIAGIALRLSGSFVSQHLRYARILFGFGLTPRLAFGSFARSTLFRFAGDPLLPQLFLFGLTLLAGLQDALPFLKPRLHGRVVWAGACLESFEQSSLRFVRCCTALEDVFFSVYSQ